MAWCPAARRFVQWCATLTAQAGRQPSVGQVRHAKVWLTDRYFSFRASVGSNHRDVTRTHPCLYQAFVQAWESLHELELALAPGELLPAVRPALPAAPVHQQIAGILLGEET